MSIREITCKWKLKRIETARRAIKFSRRTPLGDRSARAINDRLKAKGLGITPGIFLDMANQSLIVQAVMKCEM